MLPVLVAQSIHVIVLQKYANCLNRDGVSNIFASTMPKCNSLDKTSDLTYRSMFKHILILLQYKHDLIENDYIFDLKIIWMKLSFYSFIIKIFIQIYSLIKDNTQFKEFSWSFFFLFQLRNWFSSMCSRGE